MCAVVGKGSSKDLRNPSMTPHFVTQTCLDLSQLNLPYRVVVKIKGKKNNISYFESLFGNLQSNIFKNLQLSIHHLILHSYLYYIHVWYDFNIWMYVV